MNVKVRMPKFGKKPNVNRSWVKELLLTIVATSISIVLTFGTANLIEDYHKKVTQRRMAMMVIHDIDRSIKQMEKVDSLIRSFRDVQLTILEGKYSDPLELAWIDLTNNDPDEVKFASTTEHIFTSNVDTWSTIGKVDFIDNVSGCYIIRAMYQKEVIDALHKQIYPNENLDLIPLDDLLEIESDYYVACSSGLINEIKSANELNKRIMEISDKDLEEFSSNMVAFDQEDLDSLYEVIDEEYTQNMTKKIEAKKNFCKNRATMYPNEDHGYKNKGHKK